MKTKQLVAPEEVYDFLKVIWSNYETERNYENLSLMVYTLSDPDCVRWAPEKREFGNDEQLSLLNKKYSWEYGDELPEWLERPKHRLLLISELLERNLR